MPFQREEIQFETGSTLRILRWNRSVNRVDVIHGMGRFSTIRGEGDHWHYHRAMELTLIQRGAGTRFVGDRIELFDAGDLVLLGANVPHYWHQHGVSSGLSIQWDFPQGHSIWSFGEAASLNTLVESARRGLHIRSRTAATTRRLMEDLVNLDGLARLAVFLQILDCLAKAPVADLRPLSARSFTLAGTAEHQEAMRRVVSYILANYNDSVSLSELLRLTNMSRATFTRQFRQHVGKSFSSFLNQVRLQAVCRALRDTNDLVGNIALEHGFTQLSFFNRLFRREFAFSPSVYRRRSRATSSASE